MADCIAGRVGDVGQSERMAHLVRDGPGHPVDEGGRRVAVGDESAAKGPNDIVGGVADVHERGDADGRLRVDDVAGAGDLDEGVAEA